MTYTYPHNSPEIEGSRAMYPEPKPELLNDDAIYSYEHDIRIWQQSLIGYIKEPEWEDGDIGYLNGIPTQYKYLGKGVKGKLRFQLVSSGNAHNSDFYTRDKSEWSHYRPGQKVDLKDFRWVKKVRRERVSRLYSKDLIEDWIEWQPVEEPEGMEQGLIKNTAFFDAIMANEMQNEVDKFQADIQKGLIVLEQFKQ